MADINGYQEYYYKFRERPLPIRMLYPRGYDPEGATTYPLIMCGHGSGECGENNQNQLTGSTTFPYVWYANSDLYTASEPAYVIAPQQPSDDPFDLTYVDYGSDELGTREAFFPCAVAQLMRDLRAGTLVLYTTSALSVVASPAALRVDPNRYYYTGFSMGGGFGISLLQSCRDFLAAAIIVGGGGGFSTAGTVHALLENQNKASTFSHVPVAWNQNELSGAESSVDDAVAAFVAAGGSGPYGFIAGSSSHTPVKAWSRSQLLDCNISTPQAYVTAGEGKKCLIDWMFEQTLNERVIPDNPCPNGYNPDRPLIPLAAGAIDTITSADFNSDGTRRYKLNTAIGESCTISIDGVSYVLKDNKDVLTWDFGGTYPIDLPNDAEQAFFKYRFVKVSVSGIDHYVEVYRVAEQGSYLVTLKIGDVMGATATFKVGTYTQRRKPRFGQRLNYTPYEKTGDDVTVTLNLSAYLFDGSISLVFSQAMDTDRFACDCPSALGVSAQAISQLPINIATDGDPTVDPGVGHVLWTDEYTLVFLAFLSPSAEGDVVTLNCTSPTLILASGEVLPAFGPLTATATE